MPETHVAWSHPLLAGVWALAFLALHTAAQGFLQRRDPVGLSGCPRGVGRWGLWVASSGWGPSLGSAFA